MSAAGTKGSKAPEVHLTKLVHIEGVALHGCDVKADIFSSGLVLHRALTGRRIGDGLESRWQETPNAKVARLKNWRADERPLHQHVSKRGARLILEMLLNDETQHIIAEQCLADPWLATPLIASLTAPSSSSSLPYGQEPTPPPSGSFSDLPMNNELAHNSQHSNLNR